MNDETAKLIFALSGALFGMLAGAVAAKALIRALHGKGLY